MPELLSGIDTMSMPPDRYLDALMKISHRLTLLLLSAGLLGSATAAAAATSYFRFPAGRGDTVVVTAEGDLWKSSVQGGAAQRLTTHPGYETNAAISRDGQWLAFSASYEGAQDAYVMPLACGLPRRISYDNGGVLVLGWTAQGEVLISTQNTDGPASRRIVAAIDPVKLTRRRRQHRKRWKWSNSPALQKTRPRKWAGFFTSLRGFFYVYIGNKEGFLRGALCQNCCPVSTRCPCRLTVLWMLT